MAASVARLCVYFLRGRKQAPRATLCPLFAPAAPAPPARRQQRLATHDYRRTEMQPPRD